MAEITLKIYQIEAAEVSMRKLIVYNDLAGQAPRGTLTTQVRYK